MNIPALTIAFVVIALLSEAQAFDGARGPAADFATIVFVVSSILAYAGLLFGLAKRADASRFAPGLPTTPEPTSSERYL